MPNSSIAPFICPSCGAIYKVVRVEAEPAAGERIDCCNCGASLEGREGRFVLKYFLVERSAFKGKMRHSSVGKSSLQPDFPSPGDA